MERDITTRARRGGLECYTDKDEESQKMERDITTRARRRLECYTDDDEENLNNMETDCEVRNTAITDENETTQEDKLSKLLEVNIKLAAQITQIGTTLQNMFQRRGNQPNYSEENEAEIRSREYMNRPSYTRGKDSNIPERRRIQSTGRRMDNQGYSTSEEESDSSLRNLTSRYPRPQQYQSRTKLPAFTGEGESWKTWITRLTDIARLEHWDDEQKLMEILPRLQGTAGEFVFEQLSPRVRNNYKSLLEELDCRFRVIQIPRIFAAQFSTREQKPRESVEEYAVELKRLYDRAHSNRDRETRREDLLRRFLDGLLDDEAQFYVEYVKDPRDINEAVFEVVNFKETKTRNPRLKNYNRQQTREVYCDKEDTRLAVKESDFVEEDYHSTEEEISKAGVTRRNKLDTGRKNTVKTDNENDETESDIGDGVVLACIQELLERMRELRTCDQRLADGDEYVESNGSQPPTGRQWNYLESQQDRNCYRCGQEGHFARKCPNAPRMTGRRCGSAQYSVNQPRCDISTWPTSRDTDSWDEIPQVDPNQLNC